MKFGDTEALRESMVNAAKIIDDFGTYEQKFWSKMVLATYIDTVKEQNRLVQEMMKILEQTNV